MQWKTEKFEYVCEHLNISCLLSKRSFHALFPDFQIVSICQWIVRGDLHPNVSSKEPFTAHDWEACRFGECDW